jgi:hypothetical protein
MNTIIKDWNIVSIIDENKAVGNVLWGIVIDDSSCRFLRGDYVCSSNIINVNQCNHLITTNSGSLYQLIGDGSRISIYSDEFELLRCGFSPKQIIEVRGGGLKLAH